MAFPVVRVCVTVVAWCRAVFLCTGQRLLLQFMFVLLHVVAVLMCLVFGAS